MRDPTLDPTIEAAFDMARHLLGIFHQRLFLDPGRVRVIRTDDDRMRDHLCHEIRVSNSELARVLSDREREYLLRLLDKESAKPPGRGRRPAKSSRDFWIAQAVGLLVEKHGVAPTRNRASADKDERPTTACAMVAQVLRDLGINLSETGVETIWSRRRPEDFEVGWKVPLAPRKRRRPIETARAEPAKRVVKRIRLRMPPLPAGADWADPVVIWLPPVRQK
jgi:hypothetical protein